MSAYRGRPPRHLRRPSRFSRHLSSIRPFPPVRARGLSSTPTAQRTGHRRSGHRRSGQIQERLWKLPAHLPAGSTANKTGETDTEAHDIAVVNTASGRYAIAVIATAAGPDDTPDEVIAGLGRDVARALGGAARF